MPEVIIAIVMAVICACAIIILLRETPARQARKAARFLDEAFVILSSTKPLLCEKPTAKKDDNDRSTVSWSYENSDILIHCSASRIWKDRKQLNEEIIDIALLPDGGNCIITIHGDWVTEVMHNGNVVRLFLEHMPERCAKVINWLINNPP